MFHSEAFRYLDEKLNFNHHVKEKITKGKANKGIRVIKKLSNTLSRDALLTPFTNHL